LKSLRNQCAIIPWLLCRCAIYRNLVGRSVEFEASQSMEVLGEMSAMPIDILSGPCGSVLSITVRVLRNRPTITMKSLCDRCGMAAQLIRYRREINRHKRCGSAALEIVTQSMRKIFLYCCTAARSIRNRNLVGRSVEFEMEVLGEMFCSVDRYTLQVSAVP
jgi:hypothetical protein